MSTSTPATTDQAPTSVTVPAGWSVGPFRETSQTNGAGQVVQGVVFPLTRTDGATTTVFVPYSQLTNVSAVQALFDARLNGLMAVTG